jgi:hypothetical protein
MLLLALLACRGVDPAPADLDGLSQWFWLNYEAADDAAIAAAVVNLHAAIGGADRTEVLDGGLADLDPAGPAVVGLTVDPAPAAGMFMAGPLACPLADLERLLYHLEQDELYEYDAYDRSYTSDFDAYQSRATPTLAWQVTLDASVLGQRYTERLNGGLRYVPAIDEATSPFGPILISRTWLLEPAEFHSGGGSFTQDYQIEVWYERAPGDVLHTYAMWREFDWGSGFDQDNQAAIRINLNGLADWDRQTEDLCADGRP